MLCGAARLVLDLGGISGDDTLFDGYWVEGWLSRRFRNLANERSLSSETAGTVYCLTCMYGVHTG